MKQKETMKKGIMKKAASLALAVMTFATSFSCDYASIGAFAAEAVSSLGKETEAVSDGDKAADIKASTEKKTSEKTEKASSGMKSMKSSVKDSNQEGYASVDAMTGSKDGTLTGKQVGKSGNWTVKIAKKDKGRLVKATVNGKTVYRLTYFTDYNDTTVDFKNAPKFDVYYGKDSTDTVDFDNKEVVRNGSGTGQRKGYIVYSTDKKFQLSNKNDSNNKGIIIYFDLSLSITADSGYGFSLIRNGNTDDKNKVDYKIGEEVGTAEKKYPYTGQEIKPEVLLETTGDGKKLQWSSDTNIDSQGTIKSTLDSGVTSKDAGTYVMTVTLPDAFDNQIVTISYEIEPASLTSDMVGDQNAVSYNGKERKASDSDIDFTIKKSSGIALKKGTDYTISFDKTVKNAGTYTATIKGEGNYSGTVKKDFVVSPIAIDQNQVTAKASDLEKLYVNVQDQTWDGEKLTPKPSSVSYSFKDLKDTLKEGTDYTVNTDKYLNNDKPTTKAKASITLNGNYSGTITKNFNIEKGNIAKAGHVVEIYRDGGWITAGTLTGKNSSGKNLAKDESETLDADSAAFIYFTPVAGEVPHIRIKNKNGTVIGESTDKDDVKSFKADFPVATGKHWGSDFCKNWTMTVTGDGSRFYSAKKFDLKLTMKKLPLSDSHISVRNIDLNAEGGPKAEVYYIPDTGSEVPLTQSTADQKNDYKVSVANSTAGADASAVITAERDSEKYTGSRTESSAGSYGYDLSKAVISSDDSGTDELHIRLFDPFTGVELTNKSSGFTYYGDDITPVIIIQRKTGNSYKQIPQSNYTVDLQKDHGTPTDRSTYYDNRVVTINARSGGELYGSYTLNYDMVKHSFVKSDKGNWTTEKSDDIRIDTSGVTTFTDLDNIKKGLTIHMKPATQGMLMYLDANRNVNYVEDPTSQAAQTEISKASIYWTAPSVGGDGTLLKLDDDYTVRFYADKTGQAETGKVVIAGNGNYKNEVVLDLGKQNLGGDDFYVSVNGKEYYNNPDDLADSNYTGDAILPEVEVYKKAIGKNQNPEKLTEKTDYWLEYINADNVKVDRDGNLVDDDGNPVDDDGNKVTSGASGYVPKKDAFKTPGDYKIIIRAKAKKSADGKDESKYFGTRTLNYKIVGSSSTLVAKFNKPSVSYNKEDTQKPDFESGGTSGFSLKVTADGKLLERSTDNGSSGDYTAECADDLTEPGIKTYTITGINKYAGQVTTASYKVTVAMSELYKSEADGALLLSDPDMHDKTSITMYYDGSAAVKDQKGNIYDPASVTIKTATNNTLYKDTDYDVLIDGVIDATDRLCSAGSHTVEYRGVGAVIGSFTVTVNVVNTRAGLKWSGDSTTKGGDSQDLILPWRSEGYTLGQGAMSLYKLINGSRVDVTDLGSNDTIKVDDKIITDPSKWSWKDVDGKKHTIKIQGPQGSTDVSTLTFTIEYDLSQASIVLGIAESNPFTGEDVFGTPPDLSKIKVYTDASKSKQLTYNTDYKISRKYTTDTSATDGKFVNAGTIKVGLEEVPLHSTFFTGNKPEESYTITPLKENDKYGLTKKPIKTFTYNGERQELSAADFAGMVTYDGKTLEYGKDYTVSFPDDCTNVGEKWIIVNGKGNYDGSRTFSGAFEIKPYDLEKNSDKVSIDDQYYTGKAIVPVTIKVKDVKGDLRLGTDYSATNGKNNIEIGTKAQVDITGSGNFTGTVQAKSFTITRLDLGSYEPEVTEATYNKGASVGVDSHIKVFIPDGDGRIQLKRGTHYTLLFEKGGSQTATDPTDAGDYKVTISAVKGNNYVTGVKTVNFKVNPLSIEDYKSQFSVENAEWTGNAVTPKVTLNGKALDSSYKVSYSNNTDACGKSRDEMVTFDPNFDENLLPTATIVGNGNYVGTIKLHFRIGHPFSEATITATTNNTLRYNGSEQKRDYRVSYSDNGQMKTLESSRYNVRYPDNVTDAGDKVVTFTANGGPLYGTATAVYTIYPVQGSTWTAEFTNLTMDSSGMYVTQYQGAPITPEVKAYVLTSAGQRNEIPLKPSEITYKDNSSAGTASVTIKPNNYEGSKVLYFKILGVDISGDNVYAAFTDGITRRQYTGSAITPALTVTFSGNAGTVNLTKDKDYSVTYSNNTNAGKAGVKITGIGNYSGSKELDFAIFANLNDKTSVFTIPKQMYTGEPITELSGATIKAGGNDLKAGSDYTLAITSTDAFRTKGTAIFTAQGQYYEGTRTVQFEIGNDASMYNILGVAASYVYDHQAHKPVPVVTDKQGQVYAVDSVTYQSTSDGDSCINAGNVKMTIAITSHGQSVSIPYNYVIEPRNINTATFTPIGDVDYNGKAHTPSVRITEGTRLLTKASTDSDGSADYVVTYYNNIYPGTAQVTVTGINNYTGSSNLYFSINVKAAPQMIVTAMPSGRLKVTWKKVSGVSGYRLFYTPDGGSQKQVNVSKNRKSTYLTGLTRGVVYTVGVQSYITANGVNGYSTASVQQIATSTKKPTITSLKKTSSTSVKISWKKVTNATAYMVYRKAGSGKWKRVATTKSTSYTNKGLKHGSKYTYKVISYKQSGVKRSFSMYSTGKSVRV
ncbi:hypothetical protein [Candidatus Weimeria sp. HCP3S3_B5]|uniref:hypothetical protein n=1 Tax=Candidatus Weimeria sp. HCP3S3_B5 TaxID=3438871 RepID=UPI003F8C2931